MLGRLIGCRVMSKFAIEILGHHWKSKSPVASAPFHSILAYPTAHPIQSMEPWNGLDHPMVSTPCRHIPQSVPIHGAMEWVGSSNGIHTRQIYPTVRPNPWRHGMGWIIQWYPHHADISHSPSQSMEPCNGLDHPMVSTPGRHIPLSVRIHGAMEWVGSSNGIHTMQIYHTVRPNPWSHGTGWIIQWYPHHADISHSPSQSMEPWNGLDHPMVSTPGRYIPQSVPIHGAMERVGSSNGIHTMQTYPTVRPNPWSHGMGWIIQWYPHQADISHCPSESMEAWNGLDHPMVSTPCRYIPQSVPIHGAMERVGSSNGIHTRQTYPTVRPNPWSHGMGWIIQWYSHHADISHSPSQSMEPWNGLDHPMVSTPGRYIPQSVPIHGAMEWVGSSNGIHTRQTYPTVRPNPWRHGMGWIIQWYPHHADISHSPSQSMEPWNGLDHPMVSTPCRHIPQSVPIHGAMEWVGSSNGIHTRQIYPTVRPNPWRHGMGWIIQWYPHHADISHSPSQSMEPWNGLDHPMVSTPGRHIPLSVRIHGAMEWVGSSNGIHTMQIYPTVRPNPWSHGTGWIIQWYPHQADISHSPSQSMEPWNGLDHPMVSTPGRYIPQSVPIHGAMEWVGSSNGIHTRQTYPTVHTTVQNMRWVQ